MRRVVCCSPPPHDLVHSDQSDHHAKIQSRGVGVGAGVGNGVGMRVGRGVGLAVGDPVNGGGQSQSLHTRVFVLLEQGRPPYLASINGVPCHV